MAETESPSLPEFSSFLRRLITKRPVQTFDIAHNDPADYERGLFRDGVLHFDLDRYLAEAGEDLHHSQRWHEGNPGWDDRRTAESMARDKSSTRYEMIWRQRFSDKIPRKWDIWYNVKDAFEEAGKREVQLSSTLVDAGVSHDHHLVARAVGLNQRLNCHQLAWVLFRDQIPEWNRGQIIEAQRKRGMTENEIRQATNIANEARRKKRQSKDQIDEPPLELTSDPDLSER